MILSRKAKTKAEEESVVKIGEHSRDLLDDRLFVVRLARRHDKPSMYGDPVKRTLYTTAKTPTGTKNGTDYLNNTAPRNRVKRQNWNK